MDHFPLTCRIGCAWRRWTGSPCLPRPVAAALSTCHYVGVDMYSWLVRLLSRKALERRTAQRPTFVSMCQEGVTSWELPSVSQGWRRCLGASCAGLLGGRGRCLLIRARRTTLHWAPTLVPPHEHPSSAATFRPSTKTKGLQKPSESGPSTGRNRSRGPSGPKELGRRNGPRPPGGSPSPSLSGRHPQCNSGKIKILTRQHADLKRGISAMSSGV